MPHNSTFPCAAVPVGASSVERPITPDRVPSTSNGNLPPNSHSRRRIRANFTLFACFAEKRKKPPDTMVAKPENDRLSAADNAVNALSSAVNSTTFHKGVKRPRK